MKIMVRILIFIPEMMKEEINEKLHGKQSNLDKNKNKSLLYFKEKKRKQRRSFVGVPTLSAVLTGQGTKLSKKQII